MGPYHATGSSSGLPDTSRNRMPSSPAWTISSSPRSNSTRERLSASAGGFVSAQPTRSVGTARGSGPLPNLPFPPKTYPDPAPPAPPLPVFPGPRPHHATTSGASCPPWRGSRGNPAKNSSATSVRKPPASKNGTTSVLLPTPHPRRKCTPAPSVVGLDLINLFTGRMDMAVSFPIPRVYPLDVLSPTFRHARNGVLWQGKKFG